MSFRIHIEIETEGETFNVSINSKVPDVRSIEGQIVVGAIALADGWRRASNDARTWMQARDPKIGAT